MYFLNYPDVCIFYSRRPVLSNSFHPKWQLFMTLSQFNHECPHEHQVLAATASQANQQVVATLEAMQSSYLIFSVSSSCLHWQHPQSLLCQIIKTSSSVYYTSLSGNTQSSCRPTAYHTHTRTVSNSKYTRL